MGILTFIKQIFQDSNDSFSSKRTVLIGAFLFLLIAGFVDLFTDLQISQFIYDNMTYIVLGALGMATAEPVALSFRDRNSGNPSNAGT